MTEQRPYIDERIVLDFFAMLNKENIRYALIKNIAGELPSKLKDGKDVDILVHIDDREKFALAMEEHNWLYRAHPLGHEGGYNFAYNLPEYQYWQLGRQIQNFYVDACFKLMCKSLTPKTWVPLNEQMQEKAWQEREWNKDLNCWQLGQKTLFAYLFARCVFDKQNFSAAYIAEIEKRKDLIDDIETANLLKIIFFKFTDKLVSLVKEGKYDEIIQKYITFTDY